MPRADKWTAAGLLAPLNIPALLAERLVEPGWLTGCTDERSALLLLARSPDPKESIRSRLTSGLDALVERLAPALVELVAGDVAAHEQMQASSVEVEDDHVGKLDSGDRISAGVAVETSASAAADGHAEEPAFFVDDGDEMDDSDGFGVVSTVGPMVDW